MLHSLTLPVYKRGGDVSVRSISAAKTSTEICGVCLLQSYYSITVSQDTSLIDIFCQKAWFIYIEWNKFVSRDDHISISVAWRGTVRNMWRIRAWHWWQTSSSFHGVKQNTKNKYSLEIVILTSQAIVLGAEHV